MSARAPLDTGWRHTHQTVLATARASLLRSTAYLINIVRIPLTPLVLYAVAHMSYQAAGRETVNGVDVAGFLLIGIFGQIMVMSAVWETGSTIEKERFEGTIAALFLSPASRIAVIAGHGLGGLVFLFPALAVVALLGVAIGADLNIGSPLAVALSAVMLLVSALALGFLLAAFFVLSRRANLMANVIQHPLALLGGFIVPRGEFPGWLHTLSQGLPIAHAVDAVRLSTLSAGSLKDVAPALLGCAVASAACLLLGVLGIRRVEHAAKRSGQLDLY
ncbi:MAG TPA: ABC transporter permease [Thermomicrobiales bacterium]|nr:ABC transporter permease [Thermomicrobiales bacterium]